MLCKHCGKPIYLDARFNEWFHSGRDAAEAAGPCDPVNLVGTQAEPLQEQGDINEIMDLIQPDPWGQAQNNKEEA